MSLLHLYDAPVQRSGSSTPPPPQTYIDRVLATQSVDLFQYLPLNESSGLVANDHSPNGFDGAASNIAWGQPGIGDGETAAGFIPENTSLIDLYSAEWAAAWSGVEMTVLLWGRVSSAAVWSDATTRYLLNLYADGSNQAHIRVDGDGSMWCRLNMGGNPYNFQIPAATINGTTDPFCVSLSWSDQGDVVRVFWNGTKLAEDEHLGSWVGVPQSFLAVIGAQDDTGNLPFDGMLAHHVMWDAFIADSLVQDLSSV